MSASWVPHRVAGRVAALCLVVSVPRERCTSGAAGGASLQTSALAAKRPRILFEWLHAASLVEAAPILHMRRTVVLAARRP